MANLATINFRTVIVSKMRSLNLLILMLIHKHSRLITLSFQTSAVTYKRFELIKLELIDKVCKKHPSPFFVFNTQRLIHLTVRIADFNHRRRTTQGHGDFFEAGIKGDFPSIYSLLQMIGG